MYSLKNYSVHNIVCLNNTSYRFAVHCQDDFHIIPLSERTGDRPIYYNNIIDTVICSGGYASFRAAGDVICKIKNMILDTNVAIPGVSYLFGLYGAYWAEIDGLRVTNPNADLPSTGDIVSGGVGLGTSLGYLRDGVFNIANGLPYIGGLNSDFEISNCTPTHPSSVPTPTSNKMYELTPIVESDRNILRENDVNAGETFLTAKIDNDKQVIITPLLLYGLKEQHFKLLITNKGSQTIPIRCGTHDLTPQTNPNFDYVHSNVPIDWRVLDVNDTFEYEVWRKDRVITVIFNGKESPFTQLHGTHHDEVWADTTYNIHLTRSSHDLTINTIVDSPFESLIYLTIDANAGARITLPTTYKSTSLLSFEDGKEYVISIRNSIISVNNLYSTE